MAFSWKQAQKDSLRKMKKEIEMKKRIGENHCVHDIEVRIDRLKKDIGI